MNHLTLKNLSLVSCPTLIIHAKEDDTASLRNADIIQEKISSTSIEKLFLENSYHIITVDNEREIVVKACVDFLENRIVLSQ
ncbi:alpha/beta hydrolase [Legionella massiliensis]|uniref:alpha/beta hydrolase n=1 Tax=Legionella massiliensis TaxID=1034943 RepID=UPI0005C383AF|nr:hypothetical protein [Legionella massiliensis]